jgi:hypothetical protein
VVDEASSLFLFKGIPASAVWECNELPLLNYYANKS